jgi:DNA-binding CsgD family transcriptional regulator
MRQKEAIYLYEKANENPTAILLAYQAYIKADSAFQAVAHKSKISEIKLKAEVELYAQEMATKEQERQASWNFFYIVIGILLSCTFVLIGFFSRRGKKQRQEIQYLKQQLFTQIQTINQQNEAIQTIIPPQNIPQEHENETLEFDAERMQVKETDIQYLRNFNLAYKEQWSSFKESFLRIYPNFEHRLQEKIGALSNAELRLLMLHKLGLNNTEIAKSLLISPESVRTGKYRLYKKFGISSNEELDKIL